MKHYIFSFTAASALMTDFVMLAQLLLDGRKLHELSPSDLIRGKSNTQQREFSEFKKRMAVLNSSQQEILASGTFPEQQMITHLALVKTYAFYKDFCEEVLLRKTMVYDTILTDWDYNSFVSQKKIDHPELDKLAESTQKKVKQVVLLMLQQVGLLEGNYDLHIRPPFLPLSVERVILDDNAALLRAFLYDDQKIDAL